MKLKYCLTLMLCLYLKGEAQIKPLTIGDKVPDFEIKNILNYPALQSSLSSFKNDLVILDFMATTCTGCIKLLPRLDSLQKEFGNKLHIILISYEKKERVLTFLKKNTAGKQLRLPIATDDSVITKYFPHLIISHEVWIKDAVVKAITAGEEVNRKNINTLLNNNAINLPVKNDQPKFEYPKNIFDAGAGLTFYGAVTKYIKGIPGKVIISNDSTGIRTTMFNLPVINLYLATYGLHVFPESFTRLEVKGSSRFIYDSHNKDWRKQNTYSYESMLPRFITEAQSGAKMRNDLDNYFMLTGRIEKRKIICKVLVKNKLFFNTSSKEGNMPITSLLSLLNSRFFKEPYTNESGFAGKIYLSPSLHILADDEGVEQALKAQGMDVINEEREVEIFVLTDK